MADNVNVNVNVAELAQLLADAISADLDDIHAIDVLDWLASAGLTLRPDEGDSAAAYGLLLSEDDDPPTADPV
jgi:hypothetical protein